ncbi:uncharacterized protein H6S33_010323 [Morchella sextelata]|uniref:uncharacterized protein n=1 Tax=Morchella sextelata TaxID=1174677 RepID=UPI001D048204|nr:uncharacterized protein H6S33_010323 [Morchella sextelata]KAH0612271.1 hypothetical protein H6S33_010323 [Morchella sextelata]
MPRDYKKKQIKTIDWIEDDSPLASIDVQYYLRADSIHLDLPISASTDLWNAPQGLTFQLQRLGTFVPNYVFRVYWVSKLHVIVRTDVIQPFPAARSRYISELAIWNAMR